MQSLSAWQRDGVTAWPEVGGRGACISLNIGRGIEQGLGGI